MQKFHENARLTLLASLSAIALLSITGIAYAAAPAAPNDLATSPKDWGIKNLNVYPGGGYSEVTGNNFLSSGVGFYFLNDASNPAGISMRTVYFLYSYRGGSADLSGAASVTATFTVTDPQSIVNAHGDQYVRLFFQSQLPSTDTSSPSTPSCAGAGYNPDAYWWSNPAVYYFTDSSSTGTTLTVSFSPGSTYTWSNLCGHYNSVADDYAGFAAALSHVSSIGFAFSSGSGFAHGLWAADGSSPTFTVTSYTTG
jgi:hypothetical protein